MLVKAIAVDDRSCKLSRKAALAERGQVDELAGRTRPPQSGGGGDARGGPAVSKAAPGADHRRGVLPTGAIASLGAMAAIGGRPSRSGTPLTSIPAGPFVVVQQSW